jgi:hypothetical protein
MQGLEADVDRRQLKIEDLKKALHNEKASTKEKERVV